MFLMIAFVVSCRQTPALQDPIVEWFDCVECTAQQLAAVKALGDTAVPDLRNTLMTGPNDERIEAERRRLRKAFQSMKEYERSHPQNAVNGTEQDYINAYLPAFTMRNRVRAARALGAIGTPAARKALEDAQKLPGVPSVLLREIGISLNLPNP